MAYNEEEGYFTLDEDRPKACDRCGGPLTFRGLGEYRCDLCRNVMYDDYGKVRKYLDQYPGATIFDTSRATGVSDKVITAMLRAERLAVAENSKVSLTCKGCGKPIMSGMYCSVCAKLAVAANKKRKEQEQMNKKKKLVQGLAMASEGQDGKRRFTHE
ncbi:MAG: flagellar protein [Lachnospiraceae bacterium]|nr:flagellar protein [Lachnospiraceae bacterium]